MKIVIETSTLVSISVFWEDPARSILLKHAFFDKCEKLFNFLRNNSKLEMGIITKTVENEAQGVLNKAVDKTIHHSYFPDLKKKIRIMILQDVITNDCLDRLEKIVEECSIRLPINTKERDRINVEEIEPFVKKIVTTTVRYIQPRIPRFIKGVDLRSELTDKMVQSLPDKGIIYKGMPSPRDLRIMAEATMIYRRYEGKEKVYLASMDNHFKPNRVQVGSFLSGYKKFLNELDSTVRDKLAEKFGFIGDEPDKIMDIVNANLSAGV